MLRSAAFGVVAVLAGLAALAGAVGTVRALAPVDGDALAAAQVAHLRRVIAGGGAQGMAALFPEGAEFTLTQTALADLALAARGRTDPAGARRSARLALALLDDPATLARFGVDDPPGGVFLAGWALHVAVAEAALDAALDAVPDAVPSSVDAPALDDARRRGAVLTAALDRGLRGDGPFLTSYPGQAWPVDTVGAVAALQGLDRLAPDAGRAAVLDRWRGAARERLDPATGLLPHRTGPGGRSLEGPRATSSSLIALFWADAFAESGPASWQRFTGTFVVRRAGLLGVREYPAGHAGPMLGDVDSGPLIAGVSLSASVVALGAARRAGDAVLAEALQREAEVFGVPIGWQGRRRYAGGVLPVGDAFLAWARAQPARTRPTGAAGAG